MVNVQNFKNFLPCIKVWTNSADPDLREQMVEDHRCYLIYYLIEIPFNTFANRADPDQAAFVRAA